MTASRITRRAWLSGAAACATVGWPAWSSAQDRYPSRPVRIIVGLPPGGVADAAVRMLATTMQPSFGQPLVVENRAGASFQIAMQAAAQAPADGYTLVHMISPMLSAQAVHKRFDVFKSLVPIAGTGATDTTLAVGGKSPHKTALELIAWARANPGKLTYGSPGSGTLEHLALHNFCRRYGIEAVHVPFKGGPEIVQALATGQIDLGTQAAPLIVQFAPKGFVRALVLLNSRRNSALPDVPTIKEAGLDLERLVLWGGLAAPAGTPPAVVELLERQVLAAMRNADLVKQYLQIGLAPVAETGANFGKDWKDDWVWIAKAASEANLSAN